MYYIVEVRLVRTGNLDYTSQYRTFDSANHQAKYINDCLKTKQAKVKIVK